MEIEIDSLRELYFDDKKLVDAVGVEILDWLWNIMETNFLMAESDGPKLKIYRKITHTKDVVGRGWEIMDKNIEKWDLKKGTLVCLLHDVGRFSQALKNTFMDGEYGIDHGNDGAEMILSSPWQYDDKETVAEAVRWHNKKERAPEGLYNYLAKDADKLGLFCHFREIADQEPMEDKLPADGVSEIVWNNFFVEKTLVDYRIVKTSPDWILNMISWLTDIYLPETVELIKEKNILTEIADIWSHLNVSEEHKRLVLEYINNW